MSETDFSRVSESFTINVELVMKGPFRIGGSKGVEKDYSLNTNPVLLQFDHADDTHRAFVPGSSLKGVMKSSAHRIASTFSGGSYGIRDVEDLFGTMSAQSKILFSDLVSTTQTRLHTRPHVNPRGQNANFREEEIVEPCTLTGIVRLISNSPEDMWMTIAALEEFNAGRALIGGASSRGNGIGKVKYTVTRHFGWNLEEGQEIDTSGWQTGLIRSLGNGKLVGKDTYDSFYRAESGECEGCVVFPLIIECLTDITIPGIGEDKITSDGEPILPGSVIKGALRRDDDLAINKDYFLGDTSHRSHVLIGDAYPIDPVSDAPCLPQGTLLQSQIVFDNMDGGDILTIIRWLLRDDIQISGRGQKQSPRNHKVSFDFEPGWKFCAHDFKHKIMPPR